MSALRVLLVENDRDTVEMMALLLRHSHCEVAVAYDGLSALDEVFCFRPHAMLVDLAMPRMDGYEVAKQVRQDPELGNIMLAALTGYADKEHRELGLVAGFDEYLTKPIPIESLHAFLERVRTKAVLSHS